MSEAPAAPAAHGPLLDTSLRELIDELAGAGRVPGAGSVSALVVAMAAAVVAMAARASAGSWPQAGGAVAQAEALRRRALPLADEDARVLAEAISMLAPRAPDPKDRAEQRDFALGVALAGAADVPLAIAQVATDVAALASAVAEAGSGEVRPDAVGAAFLAAGAARAAAHLVEVNLTTMDDDPRVVAARSLAEAAASSAAEALASRG